MECGLHFWQRQENSPQNANHLRTPLSVLSNKCRRLSPRGYLHLVPEVKNSSPHNITSHGALSTATTWPSPCYIHFNTVLLPLTRFHQSIFCKCILFYSCALLSNYGKSTNSESLYCLIFSILQDHYLSLVRIFYLLRSQTKK
jgi:hypothetical protein